MLTRDLVLDVAVNEVYVQRQDVAPGSGWRVVRESGGEGRRECVGLQHASPHATPTCSAHMQHESLGNALRTSGVVEEHSDGSQLLCDLGQHGLEALQGAGNGVMTKGARRGVKAPCTQPCSFHVPSRACG